jgi:hypothetical protein
VPELDVGPPPAVLHFVLGVFYELSASRPYVQHIPRPIPPSELQAWGAMNGYRLRPWEVEMIGILDMAWLAAMSPTPGARTI